MARGDVEDEKDLKDDLEWQEKKSELNENGSDWQVSGDMLGDLSWVFYMWEKELYTEFFHLYWANEEIQVQEWYGETWEF